MAGRRNRSSPSADGSLRVDRFLKHYILDPERNLIEVDLMTWARWMESPEGHELRVIANDFDENDPNKTIRVSTVFLGLDHNWSMQENAPPLLFETLVFGGLLDGEMDRYETKEEALIGHQRMCQRVRESLTERHL